MLNRFKKLWQGNPVRHWVVVFVLVNLSNVVNFGNPMARLATLCSMSERGAFWIDPYEKMAWTHDWARTPDGRYYSNKAPAPALLGFPVFVAMDKAFTAGIETEEARDQQRQKRKYVYLYVLSFLYQIVPFALLLLYLGRYLQEKKASYAAMQFAAVGILFSNTASLYMNTYSGHAFTAFWALLAAVALLRHAWILCGFAYGIALLSDYGSAFLLPGTVIAVLSAARIQGESFARALGRFALGGVVPGMLWSWYHWVSFGSPFATAAQFQNPAFLDVREPGKNIMGMFRIFPDPQAMFELTLGSSRGMLWTQPWLLIILVWISIRFKKRPLWIYGGAGFLGLFIMNSTFGSWHAGGAPGPRYLSSIFPVLGLIAAIEYDRFPAWVRKLLWAGIVYSVIFLMVAYSTFITIPIEPLWKTYWGFLTDRPTPTLALRLVFLTLVFGYGIRATLQRRALFNPDGVSHR